MDNEERQTLWNVDFSSKAEKQAKQLPDDMRGVLKLLWRSLEESGPVQNWRNYSKIEGGKDVHHCHLNNNHPRYVVVWKVMSREERIIKIQYVGPHGSVNYSRFK
jgi:mRNA-degrading endonuclease RelE of RelBE toxin-antitoxin system